MTAAGTPEHDLLHSGSRWEPAATGVGGPGDGDGGFRHHDQTGVGPQDGTGTGTTPIGGDG